jgi:hypothetical protein
MTINEFAPHNRDKRIGNSLYRICQNSETKKWYILEMYSDKNSWVDYKAHFKDSLIEVIDIFNKISKEKEIVILRP